MISKMQMELGRVKADRLKRGKQDAKDTEKDRLSLMDRKELTC